MRFHSRFGRSGKARGWTQAQLAERCGIPQARISHIEQPGRDPLSLRTLYRLSSAFDVGLLVQFVQFSELVHREAAFDPKTFHVSSFKDDRLETIFRAVSTSTMLPSFRTEPIYETWQKYTTQIQPQMSPLLLEMKVLPVNAELSSLFSTSPDYKERMYYDKTQTTG